MRITHNLVYDLGLAQLQRSHERLLHVQQQLATGRRIVTPADDPVGAAQALELTQAKALNEQYAETRKYANEALALTESALARAGDLVQSARTLVVKAGNGALSDTERMGLAVEVEALVDELFGVANARDASGRYLFAGYQADAPAFVRSGGAISYQGDQGRRELQVDGARRIAVTETGASAFERMLGGNGSFVVEAAQSNTGNAIASAGSVYAPTNLTGREYRIEFTSATTFDVVDVTAGSTVLAGQAYTSGEAIRFDGMQIDIEGTPAPGDRFSVTPATAQSVFETLQDLAALLREGTAAPGAKARFSTALNTLSASLAQAEDHLLGIRASVGARLRELDSLDAAGEERGLQYARALSRAQDVDVASAISELEKGLTLLEAAQKSYLRVMGLSLFQYL